MKVKSHAEKCAKVVVCACLKRVGRSGGRPTNNSARANPPVRRFDLLRSDADATEANARQGAMALPPKTDDGQSIS